MVETEGVTEGVMIFKPPGSSDIVVTSPEQLAKTGICVHPDAIEHTWGMDAIERYRQAMVDGSIKPREFSASSTNRETDLPHSVQDVLNGWYRVASMSGVEAK